MLNSKKGVEGPIWIMVVAIILIVFLFIYSGVGTKLLVKLTDVIKGDIDKTEKDSDNDGVPDIVDKCPGKNDATEC